MAGPSSGGRRNKRKNFQPRNIRHDDDQPLDLTEADEETSRKRSRLVTDDEDGRSETSGSTEPSDHQQAVDLSVRPGSASSSHDDEASLRMNMLLWQRGQLLNQFPSADLSEVAVRHLIAGLYALPGRLLSEFFYEPLARQVDFFLMPLDSPSSLLSGITSLNLPDFKECPIKIIKVFPFKRGVV